MALTIRDAYLPEPAAAGSPRAGQRPAGPAYARTDGRAAERGHDPYRYLLLLRFALLNIVGAALLGAAWIGGYVDMISTADRTMLSAAIFVVFLGGLAIAAAKAVQISRELNAVRAARPRVGTLAASYVGKVAGRNDEGRSLLAGTLRLRLVHRISVVKHIAGALVILGLIGTVVGFIIALSGVDPDRASNFDTISPMVSRLIHGMSTALYTTLVGAVLNVWLMMNYRLLATGTVNLIAQLIEFGERHVRS